MTERLNSMKDILYLNLNEYSQKLSDIKQKRKENNQIIKEIKLSQNDKNFLKNEKRKISRF